jgi:RimJ/RimL family protein N-acetyltransferase
MAFSISSLVWATDIDVLEENHVLARRDGYWVVQSPTNPTFWWGNFLLFDDAPAAGDGDRWESLFEEAFGDQAEVTHRTFAWDRTDGRAGDADRELVPRGYELERTTGLIATPAEITPHTRADRVADVRVLDPNADESLWDQVIAVQMAQAAGEYEDAEYHETFSRRRQAALRELFRDQQRGGWYVAVLDGQVVGSLGIVVTGGRARYQAVDTVEAHRGKGVATRLVVEAARHAASQQEIDHFVIAADPEYHAIGIYESVGFRPRESVVGAMLKPAGR